MSTEICFFLPARKGSQRVKSKNSRPFSNISGGILELKLKQLMESTLLTRVVLSTNDEQSVEVASRIDPLQAKIKVIERPNHLCLDATPLTDLISYVPTVVSEPHIIWGHATTPFVSGAEYDRGIELYFSKQQEGYDSLVSVMPFQNFLLDQNGRIYNNKADVNLWPRTQDLPLLYEINHAMFIASRETYLEQKNRIGSRPFLFVQDKIKSFDIDWEDDFLIAEAIYDKIYKV